MVGEMNAMATPIQYQQKKIKKGGGNGLVIVVDLQVLKTPWKQSCSERVHGTNKREARQILNINSFPSP